MTGTDLHEREFFAEDDSSCCRIETQGGTVYWLSRAAADRTRWIVREQLRASETDTVVMHKASSSSEVDLGDKFRGRIRSDVQVGSPFVLEIVEKDSRILSEPVVCIEVGNVPEMLFDY